jgi:16S rRNA (adenine1518-N6/adenine1519-N6)-dimethyltransferase
LAHGNEGRFRLPREVRSKKELGQHFLVDEAILRREVEHAEISPSDVVLEIGAGPGNLTELLAATGARVVAIEADPQFRPALSALEKRHPNLEVVWGDATEVGLPAFTRAVGNLPYRVALPLILTIIENRFSAGVFMVQRDLGERLCAEPGGRGYGRISVTAQRRASFEPLETVGPEAFVPPPAVESMLVRVVPRGESFAVPSDDSFRLLLDFLFLHREERVGDVLGELGRRVGKRLPPVPRRLRTKPVETLTPEEFGVLSRMLDSARISVPAVSPKVKQRRQRAGRRRA